MSLTLSRPQLGPKPLAADATGVRSGELRPLIGLAVPIMLISLVNMGMSVTDATMVSTLFGTEAFAAVAVGSDLYSILFYVGAGVVGGLSPFYTAAVTRGETAARARLERIGWRLVGLCALAGVPAVWFAPRWLAALGLDGALLVEGQGYTRAMALTLVPMLGVVLLRTLLTAAGRPKLFLRVTVAMLPLNAAVNWVLMAGPGPLPAFGPAGAGLSSFLVACATLLALLAVLRRASPPGGRRDRSPIGSGELGPILRVGLPIGVATVPRSGFGSGPRSTRRASGRPRSRRTRWRSGRREWPTRSRPPSCRPAWSAWPGLRRWAVRRRPGPCSFPASASPPSSGRCFAWPW